MSFSGSEDIIRVFADEELAGTVENKFKAVGLDFATIISSFFCSSILRHRFGAANQAGILSAVELKWLMLNRSRRLFHSSRVTLPLVKMSAS